jgi:CAAX protease family protein
VRKNRYSGRQLVLAKCIVVALVAFVAGPRLADGPSEIPITILVVLAMLGASAGAYEALSHGLALLLARAGRKTSLIPEEPVEVPTLTASSSVTLKRVDVVSAFMAYLGAQALVWTIVGVVAAVRAGKGGGHGALLRALAELVPVALPGSLILGGIALLVVFRRWKKRLGAVAVAQLLGLSWGSPRQFLNGILTGVALATLILPLMGLVGNRPEPPDLMTQLAASSNRALQAWMVSAVLLAPPIEELMFRGVLLGGLAATWSLRAAALISGTTFWFMHGPEFVHWPAAVAIGLLTILATWLRVRSGSLGPSIAAHFGYNLVLAAVVALALGYKADGTRWARRGEHHGHPPVVQIPTERIRTNAALRVNGGVVRRLFEEEEYAKATAP